MLSRAPGYARLRNLVQIERFKRFTRGLEQPLIYHEPNYVLRPFNGPSITTIHDLGWLRFPEYVAPNALRWLERGMPATLERANRIIAVSQTIADELTRELGVDPRRIVVTPLGVDPVYRPASPDLLADVLRPLGLTPGSYTLAVSTLEPRKNLAGLVRAYTRLPPALTSSCPLVVVGAQGWQMDAIEQALDRAYRLGVLKVLGYVDSALLPSLYAGARALAAPSYYEGFGLPVIEAMACGTPVITSDQGALAEVAGDAAILVDPRDDDALKTGLERLLSDAQLRHRLSLAGVARARQYDWANTIERTLAAYRAALEEA